MRLNLEGLEFEGYKIIRHLTDGSFTEVYLASAPTGLEVVVKALNPHLKKGGDISDEQVLWHFENEVKVMTAISHGHVVKLLKSGKGNTREGREFNYIVVEYMRGGTLQDYCNMSCLTLSQVFELFEPVCKALSLIHNSGIIHCDIKPSNLLLDHVTHPTVIKLADFSVSKSMTEGWARDGVLVGTLPYAAPEHHPNATELEQQQPLDERADVYALAMTLLHALTGRRPDYDRRQIANLSPHPSYQGMTLEVERVLGKATSLEVEERYPSVAVFWHEFKSIAAGLDENDDYITQSKSRMVVNIGPSREAPVHRVERIELHGGVGIEIIQVPAGEMIMGTMDEDIRWLVSRFPGYLQAQALSWFNWEWPPRQVRVNSFLIGKYPVTRKQWRAVATNFQQKFLPLQVDPSKRLSMNKSSDDDHPVTNVSWLEAYEFCARISTDRKVRLPSEAEWEYACRGGTTTLFNFLDRATASPQTINYNGVKPDPNQLNQWRLEKGTSAVGQVGMSNDFGLYDMHGNVWEWCTDTWHENYVRAPMDGSVWENPNDLLRVARGGSWSAFLWLCRSASRARFLYNEYFEDVGFRIAI